MSSSKQRTVTQLLVAAADGDSAVARELFPIVYEELRRLADSYFRQERGSHTLQPTALVHEAFIKLVDQTSIQWEGRNHFFALAAKVMRNLLVNHAVGKGRAKRGGGWTQVSLEDIPLASPEGKDLDVVALDKALTNLAALDERKARLVELRFFGGLTSEDAAGVLGISRTTASEDWRMARAWLGRELKGELS